MKVKYVILLTGLIFYLSSFHQSKAQNKLPYNIKFLKTLKDKKGNLLGNVYIEDFKYIEYFKDDVFRKLLITEKKHNKTDTLYFINDCLFRNSKGIDIQFDKKTFNGYKIEYIKDDVIQLFGIGNGSGTSDPATIAWNYDKKMFEVLQMP